MSLYFYFEGTSASCWCGIVQAKLTLLTPVHSTRRLGGASLTREVSLFLPRIAKRNPKEVSATVQPPWNVS